MEGFTGIKDLDKELMLNMGDRDFIRTCQLNKYFQNMCKDDYLFKRKLERFYPDTLKKYTYDKYGKIMSWKKYYAEVVKTVALLKEKFDFVYTKGDPFFLLGILRTAFNGFSMFPYTQVFHFGLLNNDLSLIQYAVEKGSTNIGGYELVKAADLNDSTILKYLVEQGGNVSLLTEDDYKKFSQLQENI